jgi:ribokinase
MKFNQKKTNQKPSILCVGSAGKDIFFPMNDVDLKPEAKNLIKNVRKKALAPQICFTHGSKIYIKNRFIALGGCASNVAVGLARLGNSASILALTGDDSDGEWIKNIFQKENVEVNLLGKSQDADTDISVIIVDAQVGERTIFVNRDVGENLQVSNEILKNYDWCFVGSLYGKNFVQENIENICQSIDKYKIKLAYNPGQANILNNYKEGCQLVNRADILFLNKDEAKQIIKLFDLSLADNKLNKKTEEELLFLLQKEMGKGSRIVLTNGKAGAWSLIDEKIYFHLASEEKALDATGAGDAFASGFFSVILQGGTTEEAMEMGSKNSQSVIKFYGAQEGLLNMREIEK